MAQNNAYTKKNIVPKTSVGMVKCVLCGRPLYYKDAYIVVKGPKKFYYCSKQEYSGGEEYVEERNKCENHVSARVAEIVGTEEVVPSVFYPIFIEWLSYTTPSLLESFFLEKSDKLRQIIANKDIPTISNRLKYLNAVVKNNITNYVESMKLRAPPANIVDVDMVTYEPRLIQRSGMRRSIEDLEDFYDPNT